MKRESIALLGMPVENLTMNEAVDLILHMVEDYFHDFRPRQVATVNVDFLVNTLSLMPGRSRHPELLDIFRRCDLVTADGMPVIWASSLLKSPLTQRVTGADLVPALAQAASEKGKSIYLLGGRRGSAEKASEVLVSRYPGLKIAGTSSPYVITEGEDMADSADMDIEVTKMINESQADILLVGFGNPKQEIWFQRNRKSLKVPVTIGVGGTFEFVSGSVARAPRWMQNYGLEWVYRLLQEPGRLWKRYFIGLFKLTAMLLPVIIYNRYTSFTSGLRSKNRHPPNNDHELIHDSFAGRIKIIQVPERLERATAGAISRLLMEGFDSFSDLMLDFNKTVDIDLYGLGLLLHMKTFFNQSKKRFFLTGLSKRTVRFLKLNRMWDLLKDLSIEDPSMINSMILSKQKRPAFHFTVDTLSDSVRIALHGRLDADYMSGFEITSLTGHIGKKNCILDLEDLEFVDSSGLIFFIRLKKFLAKNDRATMLCNVNENIMQLLKITRTVDLFEIRNHQASRAYGITESFA